MILQSVHPFVNLMTYTFFASNQPRYILLKKILSLTYRLFVRNKRKMTERRFVKRVLVV